jgi:hypothetical protein
MAMNVRAQTSMTPQTEHHGRVVLALLLRIWDFTGLNAVWRLSVVIEVFRGFLQALQANAGIVP